MVTSKSTLFFPSAFILMLLHETEVKRAVLGVQDESNKNKQKKLFYAYLREVLSQSFLTELPLWLKVSFISLWDLHPLCLSKIWERPSTMRCLMSLALSL